METTTVDLCTTRLEVDIHTRPAGYINKFGAQLRQEYKQVDLILAYRGQEIKVGDSITNLIFLHIKAGTKVDMLLRFPKGHHLAQDKIIQIKDDVLRLLTYTITLPENNTTPDIYNPDLDPRREETRCILNEIIQQAEQNIGGSTQEWTDHLLGNIGERMTNRELRLNLIHTISGGLKQYKSAGDDLGPDEYIKGTIQAMRRFIENS